LIVAFFFWRPRSPGIDVADSKSHSMYMSLAFERERCIDDTPIAHGVDEQSMSFGFIQTPQPYI